MNAQYKSAVFMIILGGACLSLLGIGVRLMENASSFQIIFYRAVAQSVFFALVILATYRTNAAKAFTKLGFYGTLACFFLAGASLFMVLAVAYTTVANAVFIISLAPLASALLGWIFLREVISSRSWLAMAIALIGVAIIFSQDFSTDGKLGMFFAALMMLLYSSCIVAIRLQSGADMMALCVISGLLLALGIAPFMQNFHISYYDLALCIALGVVQVGLGLWLITKGAEHVPAAQVSLLALLEVVLSPIWVWIGVGEVPTIYSVIGGCVVLIGVALQAIFGSRSKQ